jgi:TetR/AcrR family tetracycline transcriptional repressor
MGRPKKPLISREAVLEVAIKIIDTEGLDALTVRRIGKELGVHAASLYYHFESREDIVSRAAELALRRTPIVVPDNRPSNWQDMLFIGAIQLRHFMLSHPALIPAMLKRRSQGMGNHLLEKVTARLLEAGVSMAAIGAIYEAMECFGIGSAMRKITNAGNDANEMSEFPLLDQVFQDQTIDSEELFKVAIYGIIEAVEKSVRSKQKATRASAKRATKAAGPDH